MCIVLSACNEDTPPPPPEREEPKESLGSTSDAMDTGSDDDGSALEPGADICLAAAPVGQGIHRGDLRGKESNNGGACERGGPDVFFDVDVPLRADVMFWARADDFEPRVGVRHGDCAARFDDAGLLCASGLPGWVLDVDVGTRLIASVGIDPSAPALAGTEPLPFELEIAFRRVLAEGDRCEPASVGRCEIGTRCAAQGGAAATCIAVPGDTCRSALPLTLRPGTTVVEIPSEAIHADAHDHACAGARTPERVHRIALEGDLGPDARIEVEAAFAEGVAVRGPGCLPEEELACAADGDTLVLAAPPPFFYLFTELPDAAERDPTGGEEAPYELRISFDAG